MFSYKLYGFKSPRLKYYRNLKKHKATLNLHAYSLFLPLVLLSLFPSAYFCYEPKACLSHKFFIERIDNKSMDLRNIKGKMS